MKFLHCTLIALMASCLSVPASAQQVNPIVFTRTTITVISQIKEPQEEADSSKTKQKESDEASTKDDQQGTDKKKKKNTKKKAKEEGNPIFKKHFFSVEVRSPDAISMEWFYSLASLDDRQGMMVLYDLPSEIVLQPAKLYKPVDVIFIDEEGTAKAIVPNVVLSNISRAVQPDTPMKAMLFLKGGITKEYGITPGDIIVHPAFVSAPVVLH